MATFPTIYVHGSLAHQPQVDSYQQQMAIDPTIRSPKDAGYVKTRARFTRYPRVYTVRFDAVSTVNKNLILAFEEARGVGADSFTWIDAEATTHTARFASPGVYSAWERTNFTRWSIELSFEEV